MYLRKKEEEGGRRRKKEEEGECTPHDTTCIRMEIGDIYGTQHTTHSTHSTHSTYGTQGTHGTQGTQGSSRNGSVQFSVQFSSVLCSLLYIRRDEDVDL